ncbi:hypothetical protein [Paenibacillus macquariensis]|uniref:hypothetical protein n=1 Tax=Paenibacillus macquariensis TaxID=948756 RepID=UPI002DB7D7E2|nr:hypothetical protein [Paenibacillus macquariensis]MEC0089358.1 hypothetical protein [Paenibacillus macquariensis]
MTKRKFEVEMEIIKKYSVKVTVEGEFSGVGDPDIEEKAKKVADNMSHDSWDYKDTEFEIEYVDEV